ncbi:unnamed protein product [Meganyctiphanes norvegica]|uniref:Uncharacterized protein n=1 Tax=Meganyctiphanes norvegica TaxID=48144 RepID=A0AAV2QEC9_MEGNR
MFMTDDQLYREIFFCLMNSSTGESAVQGMFLSVDLQFRVRFMSVIVCRRDFLSMSAVQENISSVDWQYRGSVCLMIGSTRDHFCIMISSIEVREHSDPMVGSTRDVLSYDWPLLGTSFFLVIGITGNVIF